VVGSLLAITGLYHTIFKALPFLGAGAVLHAMHSLWHRQAATS
jgi:NADH:ubiquinone oxidoreductase subunit 5 (subunit L)/multisubunit Na+/H+ antiporter MnhA subunit